MATAINLNQSPYFDDFNPLKQFYRILFNPALPVQARELTQMQTILQNQIELFGRHVFKNGTMVIPGDSSVYTLPYVKVTDFKLFEETSNYVQYLSLGDLKPVVDAELNTTTFTRVCGLSSGCIADILEVIAEDTETLRKAFYYRVVTGKVDIDFSGFIRNSNYSRIYLDDTTKDSITEGGLISIVVNNKTYTTTVAVVDFDFSSNMYYADLLKELPFVLDSNGETAFSFHLATEFQKNETILVTADLVSKTKRAMIVTNDSDAIGYAMKAKLTAGVFFVNGFFINTPELETFVDYYSAVPTKSVGLQINELIIDSDEDSSLNDPANGLINYEAPGADRLSIQADFVSVTALTDETESTDNQNYVSFIEVLRFNEGELEKKLDKSIYAELAKEFARRTYDESGNYWIRPFITKPRDVEGDSSKITFEIHPGKGYVKGYEVENIATKRITIDKPRETQKENNKVLHYEFNNSLYVHIVKGVPSLHRTYYILTPDEDNNIVDEITASDPSDVNDDLTTENNFMIGFEWDEATRIPAGTCRIYTVGELDNEHYIGLYDVQWTIPEAKFIDGVRIVSEEGKPIFDAVVLIHPLFGAYRDDIKPNFLIDLPDKHVKTLYPFTNFPEVEYQTIRVLRQKLVQNNRIINALNSNEEFQRGEVFMATESDTGAQIPITSVTVNGSTLILSSVSNLDNKLVDIAFVVEKNSARERAKKLTVITDELADMVSGKIVLSKTDVFKVISIDDETDPKYLAKFFVFDGQMDCYYTNAYLLTHDSDIAKVDKQVKVTYSYFEHGIGEYFSVDSYMNRGNDMTYDDIPIFNRSTGETVRLADCVDFRPIILNNDTSISDKDFIVDNGYVQFDIEYYLPRIDKLWVNSKGRFGFTSGVSSIAPIEPNVGEDSMHLYTIAFPSYTFNAKEIKMTMIDNRNYTMRDIAKLDKRITSLEEYTSLSLLEKDSLSMKITDANGNDRFKSGLIVDNFTTDSVKLIQSVVNDKIITESKDSIDKDKRQMRAPFNSKAIQLNLTNMTDSSFRGLKDNILTLDYTDDLVLEQKNVSTFVNVNPYIIFVMEGVLKLNPSSDFWKDENRLPDLMIENNDLANSIASLEEMGVIGTVWNDWQTDWAGAKTTTTSKTTETGNFVTGVDVSNVLFNGSHAIGLQQTLRQSTAKIATTIDVTTRTGSATRTGNKISVGYTENTQSYGDRIVNVDLEQYIRAKPIKVSLTGMRKLTKLYVFFDNVDVTANCSSGDPKGLVTDKNGSLEFVFKIPSGKFLVGDRILEVRDTIKKTDPYTTSASGRYTAQGLRTTSEETIVSTRVPNFTATKITESKTDSEVIDVNISSKTIDTGSTTKTKTSIGERTNTWDPIAQTFTLPEKMKNGGFISKVAIFLKTKSDSVPLILELRPTLNGYPDELILDSVLLTPEQVLISETATTPTIFVFNHPIYLKPETEYAFVVKSGTIDYNLWISKLGQTDIITNSLISTQPTLGSMFKSQNGRTWTPDQESDVKYQLYCCNFESDRYFTFEPEMSDLSVMLFRNAFKGTNNSKEMQVSCPNHDLAVGSYFSLVRNDFDESLGSMDDFCIEKLNDFINFNESFNNFSFYKIMVTKVVDLDTICFEFPSAYTLNFSDKAIFGDMNWVMSTAARIDTLFTSFDEIEPTGTLVTYTAHALSQNKQGSMEEIKIINKENLDLSSELMVMTDETVNAGLGFNTYFEANMTTTDKYVSPILDLEKTYMLAVANRINDKPTVNKRMDISDLYVYNTDVTYVYYHYNGDDLSEARRITKEIKLVNPAKGLKIFFTASKPAGTNIEVYYRAFAAGETVESDYDKPWYKAFNRDYINVSTDATESTDTVMDNNIANPHTAKDTVVDMYYETLLFDVDGDILVDRTVEADELFEFSSFQVKLILKSNNPCVIPTVEDFRTIAVI